jgi:putative hydrolase of the HAD superfamily
MTIRCITLDWGDTLAANYGMPYLATQRHAFAILGRDLAAAGGQVRPDFVDACMADLGVEWKRSIDVQQNPDHREFDFQSMLMSWVEATAAPGSDRAAAQAALDRCKDRLCDTVLPYTEAAPTLAALKKKGIRIGILSHVPWPGDACRRWFARHGMADHIDFYSLSCEVGWIKPNPAHFAHALEHAGVAAHEILHVGDHPMRDVDGARRAGFRTCLRWTECIYPQEHLHAAGADVTILHLAELLTAVDAL